MVGSRKWYWWKIKGLKGKRCCRGAERGISDTKYSRGQHLAAAGEKAGEEVTYRSRRGEQRDRDFARLGDRQRLRDGEWRRRSVTA